MRTRAFLCAHAMTCMHHPLQHALAVAPLPAAARGTDYRWLINLWVRCRKHRLHAACAPAAPILLDCARTHLQMHVWPARAAACRSPSIQGCLSAAGCQCGRRQQLAAATATAPDQGRLRSGPTQSSCHGGGCTWRSRCCQPCTCRHTRSPPCRHRADDTTWAMSQCQAWRWRANASCECAQAWRRQQRREHAGYALSKPAMHAARTPVPPLLTSASTLLARGVRETPPAAAAPRALQRGGRSKLPAAAAAAAASPSAVAAAGRLQQRRARAAAGNGAVAVAVAAPTA